MACENCLLVVGGMFTWVASGEKVRHTKGRGDGRKRLKGTARMEVWGGASGVMITEWRAWEHRWGVR